MRLSTMIGVLSTILIVNTAWAPAQEKKTEIRTESKKIPFTTQYQFSRDVGKGRLVTKQKGQTGSIVRTYRLAKSGSTTKRILVGTTRTEPKPEIILMGKAGYPTSRGSFNRSKVKIMEATAYFPTDGSPKGLTASGIKATYGVVAVDRRVIKLGTKVYVEGYGFAIAADTGGAIKGNKIDLCMLDRRAIYNFGRRKVRVHILSN